MAYKPIQLKIQSKYGGEAVLRMSADKAVSYKSVCSGVRTLKFKLYSFFFPPSIQGPLVTDNGNFLLDWVFPDTKYCWSSVHNYLKLIPGTLYNIIN